MEFTSIDAIGFVLGQGLPMLADFGAKYISSSRLRFWFSILVSGIAGVLMNYANLSFANIDHFVITSVLIWMSSQIAYKNYYENSTLQFKIRGYQNYDFSTPSKPKEGSATTQQPVQ